MYIDMYIHILGLLDITRVTSNIPKAGSDNGSWVYPSPQMVRT
jgi:hypothetical protein